MINLQKVHSRKKREYNIKWWFKFHTLYQLAVGMVNILKSPQQKKRSRKKRAQYKMVVQISHMQNNHINTLKDPAIHVQVWWIMETPKQPSIHLKCHSLQTDKGGCYTEDKAHTWHGGQKDLLTSPFSTTSHATWKPSMPLKGTSCVRSSHSTCNSELQSWLQFTEWLCELFIYIMAEIIVTL